MKRFVRNLLLLHVLIAVALALLGTAKDWSASDYTMALLVVCAFAFFATSASIGTSGPMSNVGGGAMMNTGGGPGAVAGMAVDDVANSEQVGAAYARQPGSTKGDFYGRWRARQGRDLGSRPFLLMLATSITTGAAALISSKFFE